MTLTRARPRPCKPEKPPELRDVVALIAKLLLDAAKFILRYEPGRPYAWPPKDDREPLPADWVADLHAHYAMHRLPDLYRDPVALLGVVVDPLSRASRRSLRLDQRQLPMSEPLAVAQTLALHAARTVQRDPWTRLRSFCMALANALMNTQGRSSEPAVTLDRINEGGVGIVFSPVYDFFKEVVDAAPGEGPRPEYFQTILGHLDLVECKLREEQDAAKKTWTRVVRCRKDLEDARREGLIAFVHAIEGGFYLGPDENALEEHARIMKERGVAYVTLAHLLPRGVADNAPSVPHVSDAIYDKYLGTIETGLSDLGIKMVLALTKHRILVDVTHMTEESICQVFDTLGKLPEAEQPPVIATHMACRMQCGRQYNLSNRSIELIAASRGIVGVIFCDHWMRESPQLEERDKFDDVMGRHLLRVRDAGGYSCAAIGSDLDGFIKPALRGLEHMGKMIALRKFLAAGKRYRKKFDPHFTDADALAICHGNVLRVLEWVWPREGGSACPPAPELPC